MAGWRTNLSLLQINPNLVKDVDAEVRQLVEEGARVWLDAALAIVPTWSRASRATFEALAQAVGYNVTYGPIRSRKDRRGLGLANGFGGIETSGRGSYAFFYRSSLEYLNFNESNRATVGVAGVFKGLINPTPYNFREAGEKAYNAWLRKQTIQSLANLRIRSGKIV